jgi:hypothetical protein
MARARRRLTLLGVSVLLLAVTGCKWFEVTVKVPDFDSRKVQGVWVWRKDSATGQWQRAGQIVFQPQTAGTAPDELAYVVLQPDGSGLPLRTPITRDSASPDQVTLRLWYARFLDAGEYRVSTYNQAGESALSPQSLDLL